MRLIFLLLLLLATPSFGDTLKSNFKCIRAGDGSGHDTEFDLELDLKTSTCKSSGWEAYVLSVSPPMSFAYDLDLECKANAIGNDAEFPMYQISFEVKSATPKFGGHDDNDERVKVFHLIFDVKQTIATGFGRTVRGELLYLNCR